MLVVKTPGKAPVSSLTDTSKKFWQKIAIPIIVTNVPFIGHKNTLVGLANVS